MWVCQEAGCQNISEWHSYFLSLIQTSHLSREDQSNRCRPSAAPIARRWVDLQGNNSLSHRDTIEAMLRRSILFATFALSILGFSALYAAAQAPNDDAGWSRKYKTPPPSSHIEVTVTKAFNGKPIENAAVIFHPIQGDKDKGGLELKTNEDGKAIIDVIPIGDTVRLQVIANGYQTYGQDYKIDKSAMTMDIKLKRPGSQYSTYGSGGSAKSDSGSSTDKSSSGATPPASSASSGQSSSSGSDSQQTPPASQPK